MCPCLKAFLQQGEIFFSRKPANIKSDRLMLVYPPLLAQLMVAMGWREPWRLAVPGSLAGALSIRSHDGRTAHSGAGDNSAVHHRTRPRRTKGFSSGRAC